MPKKMATFLLVCNSWLYSTKSASAITLQNTMHNWIKKIRKNAVFLSTSIVANKDSSKKHNVPNIIRWCLRLYLAIFRISEQNPQIGLIILI